MIISWRIFHYKLVENIGIIAFTSPINLYDKGTWLIFLGNGTKLVNNVFMVQLNAIWYFATFTFIRFIRPFISYFIRFFFAVDWISTRIAQMKSFTSPCIQNIYSIYITLHINLQTPTNFNTIFKSYMIHMHTYPYWNTIMMPLFPDPIMFPFSSLDEWATINRPFVWRQYIDKYS